MSRLRVKLDGSLPWDPAIALEVMEKMFPDIEFIPFEEAREFARNLKLKSNKEWRIFSKLGKRPVNIPSACDQFYKEEWVSWGDWLGTGSVYKKEFLPFKEAREFVRNLELNSEGDWREYLKSGKRPNNIPSSPSTVYKEEWIRWGDWLGTKHIHLRDMEYLSFEDAVKMVKNLELKNTAEWREYCKSGKKPNDIPANPRVVYRKKWKSMGYFLGTGNVHKKEFLPFKEAREFARNLKLKNLEDWEEYRKSGERPSNIPSNPNRTYKEEWVNLGDWLGTGRCKGGWISFIELKKYVKELGLKKQCDFHQWSSGRERSSNIPSNPSQVYKEEWVSWGDFLGTGSVYKKEFLLFKEAREFVRNLNFKNQKEWFHYCKSGKKPKDIPYGPYNFYKNRGWTNWYDFLGNSK